MCRLFGHLDSEWLTRKTRIPLTPGGSFLPPTSDPSTYQGKAQLGERQRPSDPTGDVLRTLQGSPGRPFQSSRFHHAAESVLLVARRGKAQSPVPHPGTATATATAIATATREQEGACIEQGILNTTVQALLPLRCHAGQPALDDTGRTSGQLASSARSRTHRKQDG